jgi:hypothetical protein
VRREETLAENALTLGDALTRVIALHSKADPHPPCIADHCRECGGRQFWPCNTLRVIAQALDLPVEDLPPVTPGPPNPG